MTEFKVDTCECGAEIVWGVTDRGKRMPVDAAPAPGGNIELLTESAGGAPSIRIIRKDSLTFGRKDLRVSHFATCPKAEKYRGKGIRK